MSLEIWLVYLLAAVGLTLTPGPNGLLSLTHGANYGLRATAWTVAGGALGFLALIALSLAGAGALLAASERAFTIGKWLGAGYLIWLGVKLWRAPAPAIGRPEGTPASGGTRTAAPSPGPGPGPEPGRMFGQGLTVAVSNPKALIFFAAFLPQFMAPGAGYWENLLVLGGTFVLVEVVYELLVAGLAHRAAPWLARHGRAFNRAAGGAFVALGAALTTAGR